MGLYLGLMSGTSMDAIDAALVDFNLGGIANITILRRDTMVTGFDTGPANRLLDAWMSLHQGKEFDAGGTWAYIGTSNSV